MLLQRNCPKCGLQVDYISEQVGALHTCTRCGDHFELVENPVRVMLYVAWASVAAAFVLAGYIGIRILLRLLLHHR